MADDPAELSVVVDENDAPLRPEMRAVVHQKKLRHRSVHVLLVNDVGDVLVPLRTGKRDEYPLHWDVSVSAHVAPDETYEQAAHRAMKEELGLRSETIFLRKALACEETDWEFTCLYLARNDKFPDPNPGLIVRFEYVEPVRLVNEIDTGKRQATPALRSAVAFYVGDETAH